jgi:hypothetical protein
MSLPAVPKARADLQKRTGSSESVPTTKIVDKLPSTLPISRNEILILLEALGSYLDTLFED